jgi:hypothetical protein
MGSMREPGLRLLGERKVRLMHFVCCLPGVGRELRATGTEGVCTFEIREGGTGTFFFLSFACSKSSSSTNWS